MAGVELLKFTFSRVLLSEDEDECAYKGMNMSLGKDKASMA